MKKTALPFNEESLRHPHDAYFKSLFGRLVLARQFFRLYLPPELAAELDLRTLELDKDSFVSERLREYFSDLVYRVRRQDGSAAFLYLLLEHKSAPDRWTPLQLLGYQVELWERAKETCGDKLPLIVPIVIYHGQRPWNVPLSFHGLVDGVEAPPWNRYVPAFVYHLCDLARLSDEQLGGPAELRVGLLLLKNIFEQDMRAALRQIADELKTKARRQSLLPMAAYLAATRTEAELREFTQQVKRYAPKLEGEIMETYAETLLKRGRQEGYAEAVLAYTFSLLTRRLGDLSARAQAEVRRLSPEQLVQLGADSAEFQQASDLTAWLRAHRTSN